MKNKTSLQLMEQLVMILVFALSAAICLQIFAKARTISNASAQQDHAVLLAQNAAECLKASCGDMDAAQSLAQPPYRLDISEQGSSLSGLREVQICVYAGEALLFTLSTGWQEAVP